MHCTGPVHRSAPDNGVGLKIDRADQIPVSTMQWQREAAGYMPRGDQQAIATAFPWLKPHFDACVGVGLLPAH